MIIVGDATTWSITSDDSRVSFDRNIFKTQAIGGITEMSLKLL